MDGGVTLEGTGRGEQGETSSPSHSGTERTGWGWTEKTRPPRQVLGAPLNGPHTCQMNPTLADEWDEQCRECRAGGKEGLQSCAHPAQCDHPGCPSLSNQIAAA